MANATLPETTEPWSREIMRFMSASSRNWGSCLNDNRRSASRRRRAWPLLVTHLEDGPSEDLSVSLQDVSSEGVGFHSDRSFAVGTLVGVKLFWSDPHALRVPAIVRHCTLTQQGFLIGVEFVHQDSSLRRRLEESTCPWYG